MRVAALEDNVAFLEQWCEEQQDTLDRTAGPVGYDYELEPPAPLPPPRALLRVVDLRDGAAPAGADDEIDAATDAIVAVVETEHDRRIRLLRAQINRLRTRLALSVAPPSEAEPSPKDLPAPPAVRRGNGRVSARPAGRTAP